MTSETTPALYAIWCKDRNKNRGDWLRFPDGAILAYETKRAAWSRAAGEYGFATYSEAKRKDWVEVRPLRVEHAK